MWKERHFVENKTLIMQHALGMQEMYLVPKYVKWICVGIFLCTFATGKASIINHWWSDLISPLELSG